MTSLAELDASNNRLTQVPMTLGDCSGLRALDLSNNQLGLLPLRKFMCLKYYIGIKFPCSPTSCNYGCTRSHVRAMSASEFLPTRNPSW